MTKKSNIINPNQPKGREINERIIELMGQTLIKENVDRSVIELTKTGPDGKVYGIVRENHEWYIKTAEASDTLTRNSFEYMGGLQNKKSHAYPSYAKAIKHLNQKFQSLNESLGVKSGINVFRNDHLLAEEKSEAKVNAQEFVQDKKGEELDSEGTPIDKENSGSNTVGTNGKKQVKNDKTDVKASDMVDMSENELKIDAMIAGEEEGDVVEESQLGAASFFQGDDIILNMNDTLSISRGVEVLDDAIDNATGEKKITEMQAAEDILKGLSKDEVISILEKVTGKKKS